MRARSSDPFFKFKLFSASLKKNLKRNWGRYAHIWIYAEKEVVLHHFAKVPTLLPATNWHDFHFIYSWAYLGVGVFLEPNVISSAGWFLFKTAPQYLLKSVIFCSSEEKYFHQLPTIATNWPINYSSKFFGALSVGH